MPPSDAVKIAVIQSQMIDLNVKVDKIDQKQDALSNKMDTFMSEMRESYVKNSEFLFWRNMILVSVLVLIAVAVVAKILNINIQ